MLAIAIIAIATPDPIARTDWHSVCGWQAVTVWRAPALWAAYRRAGGLPREYPSADAVRQAAYRNLSAAAATALAERYRVDLRALGFRMEGWREEGYF